MKSPIRLPHWTPTDVTAVLRGAADKAREAARKALRDAREDANPSEARLAAFCQGHAKQVSPRHPRRS